MARGLRCALVMHMAQVHRSRTTLDNNRGFRLATANGGREASLITDDAALPRNAVGQTWRTPGNARGCRVKSIVEFIADILWPVSTYGRIIVYHSECALRIRKILTLIGLSSHVFRPHCARVDTRFMNT